MTDPPLNLDFDFGPNDEDDPSSGPPPIAYVGADVTEEMLDRYLASAPWEFATEPRRYQLRDYLRSRDAPLFAILYEQRCGKTKVAIDTAAHQFRRKMIDCCLVVAPNGVHLNWARAEIPLHCPTGVKPRVLEWRSGRMATKKAAAATAAALAHDGLLFVCVNVDALTTKLMREAFLPAVFRRRRVMTVVDESLDISSRSAERTKVALKIAARSVSRRILDGTPLAAGPMGLWSQGEFLKPTRRAVRATASAPGRPPVAGLWGFTNFAAFRARYANVTVRDFGERDRRCPDCFGNEPKLRDCRRCGATGFVGRVEAPVIESYRNLPELKDRLAAFSARVTRAEVAAHLPPKVYGKTFFELAPEQKRVYEELKERCRAELFGAGSPTVTAAIVLTKILRLQQVTSNVFVPDLAPLACAPCAALPGGEPAPDCQLCRGVGVLPAPKAAPVRIVERDPRLEATVAEAGSLPGAGIVWARFSSDVAAVADALAAVGRKVTRYDGATSAEEREDAKIGFMDGRYDVLVGNPHAGGRGIDLSRAQWTLYHSHSWSLRARLQSEDRMVSLADPRSKTVVDVVCADTVDEKILAALRTGKNLSDLITGDPRGDWL